MEGDIIHSMEDVLIKKYGVNLAESSKNRMVTDMWNWLQKEVFSVILHKHAVRSDFIHVELLQYMY